VKILHIHDRIGRFGGGEIYLSGLKEGLTRLGHRSLVLYLTPTGSERPMEGDVTVFRKPHGLLSGIKTGQEIEALIDRERPDVVHLHTLFSPVALSRLCKKRPVIFTLHSLHLLPRKRVQEDRSMYGLYERLLRPLTRQVMKRLDRIIAPSLAFQEELLTDGILPEKVSVVPHFTEMRGEAEPVDDGRTLLFVGRMSWEKGVLEWIEALKHLPRGSWRAVIAGEGALKETAIQRVRQYRIDEYVEFIGWLDESKLNEVYRRASIVVVPSMVMEAFSLVGIEAMAHSKPVVAFNAGGVREWLADGENGFLVEQGNIEKLAKQVRSLLENRSLAKKMGEEGRRRVEEKYRREAHLDRLLAIYKAVATKELK
jgi:glycosyltransferase involved in cell wall biosynthesis